MDPSKLYAAQYLRDQAQNFNSPDNRVHFQAPTTEAMRQAYNARPGDTGEPRAPRTTSDASCEVLSVSDGLSDGSGSIITVALEPQNIERLNDVLAQRRKRNRFRSMAIYVIGAISTVSITIACIASNSKR